MRFAKDNIDGKNAFCRNCIYHMTNFKPGFGDYRCINRSSWYWQQEICDYHYHKCPSFIYYNYHEHNEIFFYDLKSNYLKR